MTHEKILDAASRSLSVFLERGDWNESFSIMLSTALHCTDSEYGFVGVTVDDPPVLRILSHEGLVWDAHINNEFYQQAIATYTQQGYLEFTNFNNLFGVAITSGQTVMSNDPEADLRWGGRWPDGHPPMRCFLGVPIIESGTVVGEIALANRPSGYSGEEQEAIELLIREAGILCELYRRAQREAVLDAQRRRAQYLVRLVSVFLAGSVITALVGTIVVLLLVR